VAQLTRLQRIPRWGQVFLVLLPVVFAYGLMYSLVTNVPMIDDFWHIFSFAIAFVKMPTAGAKLHFLLTNQVGPYKLIFDHALVALQLVVFGRLNFPLMILLGNLTLVGIFAIYWKNIAPGGTGEAGRVLLVLPVSLLLFTLNYAETVDWAISGLQQPAVILFSLAAVHFVTRPGGSARDFALAWGAAVLACLTYANGLLVWPAGLLYLLLRDRRISRLALWCVGFAATAALYLYHYQFGGHGQNSIASKLLFLAMFCGGGFENMHHRPVPYISAVIGVLVLGVVAHAVWTRFDRQNPFLFFAMIWVMLTAAVVSNERIVMGLALSLSSRYKIYCELLLIFCYGYLLERAARKTDGWGRRYLGVAIGASLLIFVGGNVAGGRFLAERRMRAETAMRGYLADPEKASPMFLVDENLNPGEIETEDEARRELNEAISMGIYRPYR
jgi:hypothetical protein